MATGIEGKLADMEIGNSMSIQIQTVIVSTTVGSWTTRTQSRTRDKTYPKIGTPGSYPVFEVDLQGTRDDSYPRQAVS